MLTYQGLAPILRLTSRVRGANLSTLERGRARERQRGGCEYTASSVTSLLTSDDTREAHSFLESDQLLTLIPLLRGAG